MSNPTPSPTPDPTPNPTLRRVAANVRGAFDRRTLGGVVIGAAIMISAMAAAAPGDTGSWFSGLFTPTTSGGPTATQTLLTDQESAMSAAMQAQLVKCRTPGQGGIADAVKNAMDAHLQLASATPNVESLFDINNDCFASITQLFDLSFAIPSLAAILSAAQNAVLQFAQKKVCTAVNKVSGMVANPINQAIGTINGMTGFGDINGMANSTIGGALGAIDPALGAEYHAQVPPGNYTVNPNPFNNSQTNFNTGPGGNPNPTGDVSTINALTQQIATLQSTVVADQMRVREAQDNLDSCNNGQHNCNAQLAALSSAQQTLASNQAALQALNTRLSQVVAQPAPGAAPVPVQPGALPQAANGQTNAQNGSSFWSSVSSLFK